MERVPMPLLRVNARQDALSLHASLAPPSLVLCRAACNSDGPVIVMIHGYKYAPSHRVACPHRSLFAMPEDLSVRGGPAWPAALGFGCDDPCEGLAIAFGWPARGTLRAAQHRARRAGVQLAQMIALIKAAAPARPVHVITHSMGSEVLFEAMHHLPANSIDRAIALTAATYHSRAVAALCTPAGHSAELFNITSRQNDMFDTLFERLIPSSAPMDRAVGDGIDAANALTVQIDCAQTLRRLNEAGRVISAPQRRVSHWSAYTRGGTMAFYADLLRAPEATPMAALRQLIPPKTAPRWSQVWAGLSIPHPTLLIRRA
jgi:pimeloyl-ACP methyl ester carboxylesterase